MTLSISPIRRVFRVVNGGTPISSPENWGGAIAWATPIDLARCNGGKISSTQRYLTPAGLHSGSRTVPRGSLIVSSRAPIGYVAETTGAMAFNQGCKGLIPMRRVDIRFFRYQLSAMVDELQSCGQGSTFSELSADALASIRISVPHLPMQRHIADYLDAETDRIDSLIFKKRQLVQLLDERAQSLRDSWFESLSSVYGLVTLRRCSTQIEQGWSPICDSEPAESHEWGVIRTSAVSSGVFLTEKSKRLPEVTKPEPRWLLRDGDLLVTRGSGSRSMVGRACVARVGNRNLTLSDLVYRVRLTQTDSDYVASALLSSQARAQIERSTRTDAGMTLKIRRDDLADIRIPAVPMSRQASEVADLVKSLSSLHDSRPVLEKQLELLAERRQAVIAAVVTGDTPVPGTAV